MANPLGSNNPAKDVMDAREMAYKGRSAASRFNDAGDQFMACKARHEILNFQNESLKQVVRRIESKIDQGLPQSHTLVDAAKDKLDRVGGHLQKVKNPYGKMQRLKNAAGRGNRED